MSDSVEKIYCCDHGSNNDALYALLANQNRGCQDPMAMMAMNGGMNNGQWNNPFVYLVWMMFANRFFGNGMGEGGAQGAQNIEVQSQLQAIRSQMSDNQNSGLIMDAIKGNASAINQLASNLNCDFNTLNACCCDVRNGISKLSGDINFSSERIINAVNLGDCHIIEALKDCCCNTQKELLRMQGANQLQMCEQTNTLQNGQRDLQVAMDKGFAFSAFETKTQTCDIMANQDRNTQKIIDHMDGHWLEEKNNKIHQLETEVSQMKQNQYLTGLIRGNNCGNCGNCGGCGGNYGCGQ